MKRFLFFALAVIMFAACSKDAINEQQSIQNIVDEAPETITVGFEGDETRIQLNSAQKTVWTKGDLVSVFYRSNANQQWKYDGETGARTAELHKVSAGSSTTKMGYVVVAYPYSEEYIISPASGNLETMLPAVQHYAVDSYGVGDNLMVSCSEFTQFSLKSVCGWLKLQLTGNGEKVKSITLRGNNGEQVAGLIHVDTKSAEATLYSEQVAPDDNGNANGSLVIDGAMVTEVMLYCDESVTLSSEATAFYIALPPQTFEEGFTVDVICTDGTMMAKSSDKKLSIERNHIQPMAAFEFAATGTTDVPTEPENPVNPNLPSNENNKIYYTTTDGKKMFPNKYDVATFGAILISNNYKDGVGELTFDDDILIIGESAFRDCNRLASVTIPDNVTTIGENVFYGCNSLTSVTIGDSVTTIGEYAFYDCYSLTSVTIPDSVTTIGEEAFYNCESLTSVTIPDSVTTIGDSAFEGCDSLTSVTIGNSVTTIGGWAFRDCSSLTSVTIPDSVTTIGNSAFYYCGSLKSVHISDLSAWCKIDFGNYEANPLNNNSNLCLNNEFVTDIVIPSDIKEIKSSTFSGCTSITSVTIPDSVTTIGNEAFYNCSSLTSVNIPDSVTSIGENVFNDCNSLTNVTIGNSLTTISKGAFGGCDGLTSVTIGNSVTTIGDFAFSSCTSLTSVTIPDSVTTIGYWAFYACTSLTSVTIPDSITKIGERAFLSCKSLKTVYCKATTPPTGGMLRFDDNATERKIYVPAGSVNAYKSAYGWSQYASSIVGYDFETGVVVE